MFGSVFDAEFEEPSKQLFREVDAGRFMLATSAIVEAEIEPAPEHIREFLAHYVNIAEVVLPTEEMLALQQRYVGSGVVTAKSTEDALHVAVASVAKCDFIVSWNFKHIVHFEKIPKYNAVNILNGYRQIGIHSPLEVIKYEDL